jgi:hypothetical protein
VVWPVAELSPTASGMLSRFGLLVAPIHFFSMDHYFLRGSDAYSDLIPPLIKNRDRDVVADPNGFARLAR